MKARIQSIDQLKEIATKQLKDEFDQQLSDALLDGAAQGMAFTMWVLETCFGWKKQRQQKLFEEMVSMMNLGESWVKSFDGESLVDHIKKEFGIEIDTLLRERCSTSVAQSNPEVKVSE